MPLKSCPPRWTAAPSTGVWWFVACLALLMLLNAESTRAFRKRPAPDPDRIVSHLTETLSLSEDQAERIRPVFAQQAGKLSALFARAKEGQLERSALRGEAQAIREETDRMLEAVLTPEQMEKYRAQREERARGRRKG